MDEVLIGAGGEVERLALPLHAVVVERAEHPRAPIAVPAHRASEARDERLKYHRGGRVVGSAGQHPIARRPVSSHSPTDMP